MEHKVLERDVDRMTVVRRARDRERETSILQMFRTIFSDIERGYEFRGAVGLNIIRHMVS